MTASSVDTAEFPRVHHRSSATPVATPLSAVAVSEVMAPVPGEPGVVASPGADAVRGRVELRIERQQARRRRRLYAFLGLSVIAVFLGATVVVVGVIR